MSAGEIALTVQQSTPASPVEYAAAARDERPQQRRPVRCCAVPGAAAASDAHGAPNRPLPSAAGRTRDERETHSHLTQRPQAAQGLC